MTGKLTVWIIIRKINGDEVGAAMEPALEVLTLNSSPYGLPSYLAIGFEPTGEEREINVIRFTPMRYVIKR